MVSKKQEVLMKGFLQFNPDVAAAGLNPLEHWISHGQFEGRGQFGIFNYNEFDFF